jgi:EAL domain-containing protein (putative c-di-GMP-specific phosphodiesterase class I)
LRFEGHGCRNLFPRPALGNIPARALRWRHPIRGLVGPNEFIPVAEDTGLIRAITQLTLTESCQQMVEWQRRFGAEAPGVMCVNISSRC